MDLKEKISALDTHLDRLSLALVSPQKQLDESPVLDIPADLISSPVMLIAQMNELLRGILVEERTQLIEDILAKLNESFDLSSPAPVKIHSRLFKDIIAVMSLLNDLCKACYAALNTLVGV